MALCHPTHTPFWQSAMWPPGECGFLPSSSKSLGEQQGNRQNHISGGIFSNDLFFDHTC